MYVDNVPERYTQREIMVQKNWETALRTYRNALSAYRRFLKMQERHSERTRLISQQRVNGIAPAHHKTPGLEGLTPRECEVAALVARGYTNHQIANTLVLTPGTVANHVAHVLYKLGVANRTQVAARVLENAASSTNGVARSGLVVVSRSSIA